MVHPWHKRWHTLDQSNRMAVEFRSKRDHYRGVMHTSILAYYKRDQHTARLRAGRPVHMAKILFQRILSSTELGSLIYLIIYSITLPG